MPMFRSMGLAALGLLLLTGALVAPQPSSGVALAQEPDKAVQPPAGPAGTTFAFFATGLGGNDDYVFWATSPDGTVFGNDSYKTRSSRGRADWQWTSPADARPGFWTMVIQKPIEDDDDDREEEEKERDAVTIQFQILGPGEQPGQPGQPAPPPADAPEGQQAVQPAVGAPGGEFAFFATGFDSNERVGFWINAPNGEIISDSDDYETSANSDGRADWRWESSNGATRGFYTMVARGTESGVERVIPFEIR
jgi:hypothetical protein